MLAVNVLRVPFSLPEFNAHESSLEASHLQLYHQVLDSIRVPAVLNQAINGLRECTLSYGPLTSQEVHSVSLCEEGDQ